MGFIDELEGLELAEDIKEQLIRSHRGEVEPLKQTNETLEAKTKKESVNAEIKELKALFGDEAISALKYARRVFLSKDAEEPGAILLSDADLELSGEDATGASGKEDVSVAGALRHFISLLPREEGKLKIQLSEQVDENAGVGARPPRGDEQEPVSDKASRISGREVKRDRSKRYTGFVTSGT